MQFRAPPLLTASNAGMPTTLQPGKAMPICSNACSSSGIPSWGTSTRLPTCRKLMYAQLRACSLLVSYFKGITSKRFLEFFGNGGSNMARTDRSSSKGLSHYLNNAPRRHYVRKPPCDPMG